MFRPETHPFADWFCQTDALLLNELGIVGELI